MPEAIVRPYPVETPELRASHWWATTESAERMAAEYSKYLVVLGRETLRGFGGKQAPASQGGGKA
jgi:hypothetical protein